MRSEETPPRAACSPCWRSISWKAAAWSLAPPLTAASICGTPPASAREELWRLRGAKYVQSDLEGVFREVRRWLDQRPVLFSGTPCQVDGCTAHLGGRPGESDHLRPGVPRRALSRRVGGHGPEPGGAPAAAAAGGPFPQQGRRMEGQPFYRGLRRRHRGYRAGCSAREYGRPSAGALFLRPSCYRCPYASMTRVGDLTLGDFWGLRPDELPDQQEKGISLLLVNTPHGSHIFDQLPLAKQPFPPERAIAGNPRLASPIPLPPERTAFFAAYALEPFDQVRREFCRLPPLPVRAAGRCCRRRSRRPSGRS